MAFHAIVDFCSIRTFFTLVNSVPVNHVHVVVHLGLGLRIEFCFYNIITNGARSCEEFLVMFLSPV